MAGQIFHEWQGTRVVITSDSGTSSCDLKGNQGDMGVRGPQGEAGLRGEAGVGVKGDKGDRGAAVVSTVFVGVDENGGNVYEQTFEDGSTAQFTAPKGSAVAMVRLI